MNNIVSNNLKIKETEITPPPLDQILAKLTVGSGLNSNNKKAMDTPFSFANQAPGNIDSHRGHSPRENHPFRNPDILGSISSADSSERFMSVKLEPQG